MSTRKIKVLSTIGVSGTIETNVTTLGELKPLLAQREIDYSGMKMMVGETRNELSLDDAVLPEGDFKLYLMPQKTKSGSIEGLVERLYDIATELEEIGEELAGHSCSGVKTSSEDLDDLADLRAIQAGNPLPKKAQTKTSRWLD